MLTVGILGEIHLLLYLLAELGQREEREEGRHNHSGIELCVGTERQQRELEGEHPLDEQPSQTEVLDAEEHPDDVHQEEGQDDARHFADFLHHLAEEELVSADEEAVQCAPEEEIP